MRIDGFFVKSFLARILSFFLDNLSLFRYFIDGFSGNFLGCFMVFPRAVPENYRFLIPEYVKEYVSLNQFAA